jgi:hypothetical protein
MNLIVMYFMYKIILIYFLVQIHIILLIEESDQIFDIY